MPTLPQSDCLRRLITSVEKHLVIFVVYICNFTIFHYLCRDNQSICFKHEKYYYLYCNNCDMPFFLQQATSAFHLRQRLARHCQSGFQRTGATARICTFRRFRSIHPRRAGSNDVPICIHAACRCYRLSPAASL